MAESESKKVKLHDAEKSQLISEAALHKCSYKTVF